MPASALHDTLKSGTRECHARVDAAFSRFDFATDTGLEGFLTAQALALLPLERAVERDGTIFGLVERWGERRRSHLLPSFGLDIQDFEAPEFTSASSIIGAAYVLEGSKLGARVLLKRLPGEDGPFRAAAVRFLSHGVGGGDWTSFLACLDRHAAMIDIDDCRDGALLAFSLFERAALSVPARRTSTAINHDAQVGLRFQNDPGQYMTKTSRY